MDWFLPAADDTALRSLRHEIRSYLERHVAPDQPLDQAELIVGELLGNVFRHAQSPAWVSLTWEGEEPEITVRDLGPGFDSSIVEHNRARVEAGDPEVLFATSGRGLYLIQTFSQHLHTAARDGGGMSVGVALPLRRPPVRSFDPPRHDVAALPALEESQPGGGFGRESFLRALVVQLAQAVEFQNGPNAAEAAVAQVGADVGGQMEAEYRLAQDVVDRLTPEQIGECYVRLKAAIGGTFEVVEATPERIVLTNTQCPFGPVVQKAPALCRMTSSVFGGIAARNSSEQQAVDVVLEERIAVGDPGCRVTVHLVPADGPVTGAHRYTAAS